MKYDSNKIIEYKKLSKENILKETSEEEIMRHYLGFDFRIGRMYNSPFRDDNVPSFNVYYSEYQELRFKDFNGSQGTCFDLVMLMNNCNFYNALLDINDKLGLCLAGKNNERKVSYKDFKAEIIDKKCLIQFKPQQFTDLDIKYWNNYGISVNTLKHFNVYSAKFVFLNKQLLFKYNNNSPIYCYKFENIYFFDNYDYHVEVIIFWSLFVFLSFLPKFIDNELGIELESGLFEILIIITSIFSLI